MVSEVFNSCPVEVSGLKWTVSQCAGDSDQIATRHNDRGCAPGAAVAYILVRDPQTRLGCLAAASHRWLTGNRSSIRDGLRANGRALRRVGCETSSFHDSEYRVCGPCCTDDELSRQGASNGL